MAALQFAPWSSSIELSFYSALASTKINHDRLSDAARQIVGRYELRPSDLPERSAHMQIHGNAFAGSDIPAGNFRAEGTLKNVNTIEEFKNLDRTAIIQQAGRTIWEAILDGTIYSGPSLLSSFYAIFFADLKRYRYTYHFAFPALHSDPPWKSTAEPSKLSAAESLLLFDAVQTWRYAVDTRQHGFFLAKRGPLVDPNMPADHEDVSENGPATEDDDSRPTTPRTPKPSDLGFKWIVGSLSSYEHNFFEGVDSKDRFVCFVDPSTYPQNPAWPLRNLLVLIKQRWHLDEAQIICYRDTHMQRDKSNSVILNLKTAPQEGQGTEMSKSSMPKVTGWERNDNGKPNNKVVDLSEYMDPHKLADQSVDLNLKLMKWRIAPDLDLDTIKNTKCLLLGAGTLGSYVSRNLLGWGVRKITLIDNAKVSFSNPVRQPLFTFEDCKDGGARKAERAAQALKEIYPGVDSTGHVMSVPMAGHPITNEETTKRDFETLKQLIDEHDAIFLLMDTRESRWLPTVMGKAADKIVVNAALGFDTYVVMRHGASRNSTSGDSLGCYFCNDVVAPADSLKDQTLDQQCTVTRPGIAAIASALLVELVMSVLQHPKRHHSPAPQTRAAQRDPLSHPLGLVPHQIRGFLSSFDNMLIKGPAYDCCSACSEKILGEYEKSGWDFVKRALNEKGYVEELSGLAEVQRKAELASADVDWDEEEEEGEIPDEGDGELI